jgi:hypothetical protein
MLDRTVPSDRGPRPTPAQIKEWYRELTILLNRLEQTGEVFTLVHTGTRVQIVGQTAMIYKSTPNVKGTWSWQ